MESETPRRFIPVLLQHFIDAIRQSSNEGRRVTVA
jgi:hypothetical protein